MLDGEYPSIRLCNFPSQSFTKFSCSPAPFFLTVSYLFLKLSIQPLNPEKPFTFCFSASWTAFSLIRSSLMAISWHEWCWTIPQGHIHEQKATFIDVFIFDEFSPHSGDAFSISECFTIVVNVDSEILRRSVKAHCSPTFLSNLLKMLHFSLNEKCFCFSQSFMHH